MEVHGAVFTTHLALHSLVDGLDLFYRSTVPRDVICIQIRYTRSMN